jgi:hypothetical protein
LLVYKHKSPLLSHLSCPSFQVIQCSGPKKYLSEAESSEEKKIGSFHVLFNYCEAELMEQKKIGSFSLIERVILSAGAMLIFSVSFQK